MQLLKECAALPYDMTDEILGHLALPDLARVSTVCRTFQEVYLQKLAVQQKARCSLANDRFGRERIKRITDIITRFLEGRFPGADFPLQPTSRWWVSSDGEVPVGDQEPWPVALKRAASSPGESPGWITLRDSNPTRLTMGVMVDSRSPFPMILGIDREGTSCTVALPCWGTKDVDGLAFVQALFTEGFSPTNPYGGLPLLIRIQRHRGPCRYTASELQAQVAPLLPLAARHTTVHSRLGHLEVTKEHMQCEQGAGTVKRKLRIQLVI
jgi:hypothetical protein